MPPHLLSLGLMIAVRILTAFAIMKYISGAFGPEQFGILVHIIGTAAIFYSFSGSSLVNGVTRVVAAEDGDEARIEWLRAAMAICLAISTVLTGVALFLFLFAAKAIFDSADLAPLLILIAGAQFVVGFGNVVLAFFVGAGNVRTFVIANVAGSIVTMVGVILVASTLKYGGAVYAVAVMPVAPSLFAVAMLWWAPERRAFLAARRDPAKTGVLLRHSAAMMVAICSLPIAQFLIRLDMSQRFGWDAVGFWQAIARISDAYMQVYAILFVNFLLPTLTRVADKHERLRALSRFGGGFILLFLVGAIGFGLLRDLVIRIAYSSAFLPADVYVVPQLVGDFLKVGYLMVAYYFMASGRIWVLGMAEGCYSLLLIAGYHVLVPAYGPIAPAFGHVIASSLLFVAMAGFLIVSRRHQIGAELVRLPDGRDIDGNR